MSTPAGYCQLLGDSAGFLRGVGEKWASGRKREGWIYTLLTNLCYFLPMTYGYAQNQLPPNVTADLVCSVAEWDAMSPQEDAALQQFLTENWDAANYDYLVPWRYLPYARPGASRRAHRKARQNYIRFGAARNSLADKRQLYGGMEPEHLKEEALARWTPDELAGKSVAELAMMLMTWGVALHAYGRYDAARAIFDAYAQAVGEEKALQAEALCMTLDLELAPDLDVLVFARELVSTRRENRRPPRPRHSRPVPPTASTAPPQR